MASLDDEMTDDDWLLEQGIDADPDELHDFKERVGKFFYDNTELLRIARIRAKECLELKRSQNEHKKS